MLSDKLESICQSCPQTLAFLTPAFNKSSANLWVKLFRQLTGLRSKNARDLTSAVNSVSKTGPRPKMPIRELCWAVNLLKKNLLETSISKKSTPARIAFLASGRLFIPWAIIFTYL